MLVLVCVMSIVMPLLTNVEQSLQLQAFESQWWIQYTNAWAIVTPLASLKRPISCLKWCHG